MFSGNWNPSEVYKQRDFSTLLDGHYYNYSKNKSYKEGQITVGFLKIEGNKWLLFHIGRVIKDLNVLSGVGYEYENIPEYEKYCGRLVIDFKNRSQTMIRKARSVIGECRVQEILSDDFNNDVFPGYENVRLSWHDLKAVICKDNWSTALQNQKAVYLITDKSNGKMYVGSASGKHMLLGRWQAYVKSGHGNNVGLKELPISHIKNNFEYSILDIFKSTTDDNVILKREAWWKKTLNTRMFGYNRN
ncbi:GIY-YIG nuclease family protein [Vibrio kyushuensis]|uniref:GIY-YIG nuclease family protein n=1 Tax=Vibrio kyushuensis TaxID=2910249 RepID=UPI003D12F1B2